ncbi:serine hydrolase domain-containing protein [candidate division KSB1 bacterium]
MNCDAIIRFKIKRIIYIIILAIFLFCSKNTSNPVPEQFEQAGKIDQLIADYTEQDNFSGIVLIAKHGNVVYEKAVGYADRENTIENRMDSRINLCSMGKMFTAVSILKLVQEGELRLDDNIGQFLNGFLEDIADNVTIHHLLSHTSGLRDYMAHSTYMDIIDNEPSISELIELIKEETLQFEPGLAFSYSNSGFVVLGAIIEHISGKEFPDYINENIFTPLNMNNSSVFPNFDCIPYYRNESDQWEANTSVIPYPSADGGTTCTARDLFKFDVALHSYQLINKEYTDLMFTPVTRNILFSSIQGRAGYGYGSMIKSAAENPGGKLSFGHNGQIPGLSHTYKHFPSGWVTIIVFSNYQTVGFEIEGKIEEIVFE